MTAKIEGKTVDGKRRGFTLVELLTTIGIIAILIALLVPSLSLVRKVSKETAQKSQFATIDMALGAFKNDYGEYPPSNMDPMPFDNYCGAQKLAEALVGWDLLGFHPKSAWRADGFDGLTANGEWTYDPQNKRLGASLDERRGPYLELATAKVFRLGVSGAGANDGLFNDTASLDGSRFVICDVFGVKKINVNPIVAGVVGKSVSAGTPIFYYRANTSSKNLTDAVDPVNSALGFTSRIYNVYDNDALVRLGVMTDVTGMIGHPLKVQDGVGDYPVFYNYEGFNYGTGIAHGIVDPKVFKTTGGRKWPYRPDSYILISAGMDGLYGTSDDIHNF